MRTTLSGFLAVIMALALAAGCETALDESTTDLSVDDGMYSAAEWSSPDVFEFEGRKIDLADGWGDIIACMVWRAAGVKECFRTDAEWEARIAEVEAEMGMPAAVPDATCSNYAVLYDWSSCNSSSPKVSYHDLGCQALSPVLNNKVSSGKKNACYVYFYDSADCTGGVLAYATPGSTSTCYGFSSTTTNRASSIYMQY